IFYMKDTSFVKIKNTKKYITSDVQPITINNDKLVIVNRDQSIIIDFKKYFNGNTDFLQPFYLEKVNELLDAIVFGRAYDPVSGKLSFSTIQGIFVYDSIGNLQNHLTKESGLLTNTSFNLGFDNYSNLWVASDKGVSCIYINSPFTLLTKAEGVGESNLSISEYKNSIYLSSMTTIKKLDKTTRKFVTIHSDLNNFNQLIFPIADDSILFLSSDRSIYYTFGNSLRKLLDFNITLNLCSHPRFPNRLFFGTIDGEYFVDLTFSDKKIIASIPQKIPKTIGMVNGSIVDSSGNLWISTYFNGIYKVNFTKDTFSVLQFDTLRGLPEISSNIVFYDKYKKEILFATKQGIYKYDSKADSIVKHPEFSQLFFDKHPAEVSNITVRQKKILVTSKAGIIAFVQQGNKLVCDSISYKHMAPSLFTGSKNLVDHTGSEWITTLNYVVCYSPWLD
ncbi:MAG: hypothetical protein J7L46_05965, partial [Bacteroidales bacterium]|nr:hypothetical protein [Bacteroidales bacterium]